MRNILVVVSLGLLVAAPAAADAPAYLPVQGVLANTDGTPVDGDTVIRFGLYTADIGGTELWNETQSVPVDQGFFTVYLGDTTVLDLALFRDHQTLYLGVKVGSDAEMTRFQIALTGYAAYAQYAGDAATLGGTPASGFLTSAGGLAWGSITGIPAGFADGTDDVGPTYAAGAGLTLTGGTFAVDQATIQGWAQAVSYDTVAELRSALDAVYAPIAHTHAWGTITGIPAGFADGVDNDTTYSAGAGLSLTGTSFAVSGVTSAMITDGTIAAADIGAAQVTLPKLASCAEGQTLRFTGGAWACTDQVRAFSVPGTASPGWTAGLRLAEIPGNGYAENDAGGTGNIRIVSSGGVNIYYNVQLGSGAQVTGVTNTSALVGIPGVRDRVIIHIDEWNSIGHEFIYIGAREDCCIAGVQLRPDN